MKINYNIKERTYPNLTTGPGSRWKVIQPGYEKRGIITWGRDMGKESSIHHFYCKEKGNGWIIGEQVVLATIQEIQDYEDKIRSNT